MAHLKHESPLGVAMIDFWFRVAVVVIVIAVTYWFVETYPVTAALFGLAAFGLIFLISANNNRKVT
jgi:hypothetical protein